MRLFGLEITRAKAAGLPVPVAPPGGGGWINIIREPFTGAWQRGFSQTAENILTYHAVYSCVTLIASDVAKCCVRLMEQDDNGIWSEVSRNSPFWPVLRKPNRYQNRIKFFEQWVASKLLAGNTYALVDRDARGIVTAMYVLDPMRVRPLVAPDGSVFYKLSRDNLAGIETDEIVVPASEIIHDVMIPLYHPLVGVSPLTASGIAAVQGLTIQRKSTLFFENGSNPSGVLVTPGVLDDADAVRYKRYWEEEFRRENTGRVAILGGGLQFKEMSLSAVDAQLIDQLKWSAQTVCSTMQVPPYKVGVGDMPPYQNIEAQEQQYYSQCLQKFFECIEICLDEGLGLTEVSGQTLGTEFDLYDLLRMDTATLIESEKNAVTGGIKAPNESRARLNLPPVAGGDTPYLQRQNYSLAALAKRDASADPFASTEVPAKPPLEQVPTKSFSAEIFQAALDLELGEAA